MSDQPSDSSDLPAIGIDLGGTSVKIGLCVGDDIVRKAKPIATQQYEGPDALTDRICEEIENIRQSQPNVAAVGVGVPGFVDWQQGIVHALTNVPGWVEIPLRDILENRLGLPVRVDNDANAMAFAEYRFGAGRGARCVLAITLGTGVGGGLVINGKVHRGVAGAAGEIGQTSIDYRGLPGVYQNRGALEQYIGSLHFAERAAQTLCSTDLPGSIDECTPRWVAQVAEKGNRNAHRVWREVAEKLACGLANVIWLLNPDRIVIGGGMAAAGDLLFQPLREYLKAQLHRVFWECLEIVPARFGNEAGILGAACLALDECAADGRCGV